jgi:hypothetical protein
MNNDGSDKSANDLKKIIDNQSMLLDHQKKLLQEQGDLLVNASEQLMVMHDTVRGFSSLIRYLRHIINENGVQLDTQKAVSIYEEAIDGKEFFAPTDASVEFHGNGDEDQHEMFNFSVNFDADEDNEKPVDISSWNGFSRKWVMRDRNN